MKPEIAGQLADELESGRWLKTIGLLGEKKNYRCCLGVLQEIAPAPLIKQPLHEGYPSAQVRKWCDLSPDEMHTLVGLNDTFPGWNRVIDHLRRISGEITDV